MTALTISALALAVAWATSGSTRRAALVGVARRRARAGGTSRPGLDDLVRALGRLARRAARQPAGDATEERVAGGGAIVAVLAALVGVASPPLGALAAVVAVVLPRRRRRRAAGVARSEALERLPDTVDLLLVAARAGLPALGVLVAVAPRAPPPWGPACAGVVARHGRGERLVDALDALVDAVGEPAWPVRSALRASALDGAALVAALERLAGEARDARRRRAEEAARRVPVRLLLPLVACSLPALALLSIVPILAGALEALAG